MDGPQIRQAREALGWTQEQLAAAVQVSPGTIGNWERGNTVPKNRAGRLAAVLGLNASEAANPLENYSNVALLTELLRRSITEGRED